MAQDFKKPKAHRGERHGFAKNDDTDMLEGYLTQYDRLQYAYMFINHLYKNVYKMFYTRGTLEMQWNKTGIFHTDSARETFDN